jgi:protein involved in polysaccharide export with SLBB domain
MQFPLSPPAHFPQTDAQPVGQQISRWRHGWFDTFVTQKKWILGTGLALGLLGLVWGRIHSPARASLTLMQNHFAVPSLSQLVKDESKDERQRPALVALMGFLRSAEFCSLVCTELNGQMTPDRMADHLQVECSPNEGLIHLRWEARNKAMLVPFLETCGREAIAWANAFASAQAGQLKELLGERLEITEKALATAHTELIEFQRELGTTDFERELSEYTQQRLDVETQRENTRIKLDTVDVQVRNLLQEIARHHPALLAARQELDRALLRYTEEHPRVQELRATLERLRNRLATQQWEVDPEVALQASSLAQELYSQVIELRTRRSALEKELEGLSTLSGQLEDKLRSLPGQQPEFSRRESLYGSLKATRDFLIQCQAEATLLSTQAPKTFRVLEPARMESPALSRRWRDALALGAAGGILGFLSAWLCLGWMERRDHRIRSPKDLERATQLPVLATLGDLQLMDEEQKQRWAFDTLTELKGKLTRFPREALVCGFASSRHGEGRSTWVNLLAEAAQQRGYRVLTIFAGPTGTSGLLPGSPWAVACQPVASPAEITGALAEPVGPPRLNVRPADWAWNLQCREDWQAALRKCRMMENLVVFVELPPAAESESLLLSENLSQVIWLCGKDMVGVAETRKRIDMFKYARAELAGAVLNSAPRSVGQSQTQTRSWVAVWAACLGLLAAGNLIAQETNAPPSPADPVQEKRGGTLSISSPSQAAPWQRRLTLGPGDVLSIGLYAQPETLRNGLVIGPDGRLNYLQAQGVVASGLTVDELRTRMEEELAKFYRPPIRAIILPQAYNSKKYYLLGNVIKPGVFSLNRPLTIMEAIAQAGGFVAGTERKNTVMMADLARSFLVRKDASGTFKRAEVDFENLFLRGDLRQNVPLAPDDYLYFPPMDLHEIYVLGAVVRPGRAVHAPDTTLLRALIAQGGFVDKAYRSKVLVVRGSLNQPESFVVNVNDILQARTPDFKLEPRDIVYVSRRPWARAEELLEFAITEFLRAAIVSWTGVNVGPWIKDPIFPSPKGLPGED